jgi:hypothetical protein
MPPKLANGVRKIAMVAPLQWIAKIGAPSSARHAEAIRQFVELGLEAAERRDKKPKT